MSKIKQRMKKARLTARVNVGEDNLAVFTYVPGEPVFDFKAGQYAYLGIDVGEEFIHRLYSIASSPYSKDHLEFYIILVKDGTLTPHLFGMRPGEEIYYMGPAGKFTLDRAGTDHALLIGTGTGLAPYMSMLRMRYADYRQGRPSGPPRSFTVMHGVSYSKDLGYRKELEEMASDPGFDLLYLPTVSRPDNDPGWTEALSRGRVNDVVRLLVGEPKSGRVDPAVSADLPLERLRERIAPERAAAYLCGNPGMLADMQEVLAGHGFAKILREDYW